MRVEPYSAFLKKKSVFVEGLGIEPPKKINPMLYDFQADIVRWALRKGRSALFLDCGMGKTPIQLEWARHIPGKVLILAPLAVSYQTVREGEKFGVQCSYARNDDQIKGRITVANYEMMDHFDHKQFAGIVLDESSILKSYDGKTRMRLIEAFRNTPYRLACTATPAPNDYMELSNHAEFMGIMKRQEMLSMFFVHDAGETQKWRLKGHAEAEFWKWLCSWSVLLRKPSDLRYEDGAFILPELNYHDHILRRDRPTEGHLFAMPANTLQERIRARAQSVEERSAKVSELVNADDGQWIVWCNLNVESTLATRLIRGAVEVKGSDSNEHKEASLIGFADGKIRVLVTKPSIAGHGMNFQRCSNMAFLGLSDSWESWYQAVRRCWRFGQADPVDVHVVTSETEGAVVSNIKRKEEDANRMAMEMLSHMRDLSEKEIRDPSGRTKSNYTEKVEQGPGWKLFLGDCVETVRKRVDDESIGYSIFSPPFASLYTYSNSERDMGNCSGLKQFSEHFRYLVAELYRAMKPGRLVSVHCMDLPSSKTHDGFIGLKDFRGEIIRMFADVGFYFHSTVVIWKDPVTAMQRTKALGLLYKQLKKDSCMSRQGIPDYLISFRKPGENKNPVTNTERSFPLSRWQEWASPIWGDINPSDTLQYRSAREHKDERHIAPLQLEVIRRGTLMWSNPGDLVLSPFAGIGSEGYVALQLGREFVGVELKESYWRQAARNLAVAREEVGELFKKREA